MKIFRCLNCSICQVPLSSTSKESSSPWHFKCGSVVCFDCAKEELALDYTLRKHPCCLARDCRLPNIPAYFLIDLLSNDSLILSPEKDGYILSKPIQLPECPICEEEYSLEKNENKPFRLWCNHLLCNGCFEKMSAKVDGPRGMRYTCKCPICQKTEPYLLSSGNLENALRDFLKELPEMLEQMNEEEKKKDEMRKSQLFLCYECQEKFPFLQMFNCRDCSIVGERKICGGCSFRRHRTHNVIDPAIEKMLQETKKAIDYQVHAYKKMFSTLHGELMKNVSCLEKELNSNLAKLEQEKYDLVKEKNAESSRKVCDQFESLSEDYLPQLRTFNTKLLTLLETANLVETKDHVNPKPSSNQNSPQIMVFKDPEQCAPMTPIPYVKQYLPRVNGSNPYKVFESGFMYYRPNGS